MNPQETVAIILEALIEHGVPLEEVYVGDRGVVDVPGILGPFRNLVRAETYLRERYPELREPDSEDWIRVPENCIELLRNSLALCSP